MPPKTNDHKIALTRERILAEAVLFADEHGVDALSMRKLAERLGAGTMSLYNHVANKDDMIEGMVDVIVGEIANPESGPDWQEAMRVSAASAHRALLAHPWAAAEWSRRKPGPTRARYMEALLRVLTEAGLGSDLVYRGYHAITMHVVGFSIQELGYETAPVDMDFGARADEILAGLEAAKLPYLAEHVRAHVAEGDEGDEFGFVLDLILGGLDRAGSD